MTLCLLPRLDERLVVVDADDEEVAHGPRSAEIAYVAHVEEVEAAVAEDDLLPLLSPPRRWPSACRGHEPSGPYPSPITAFSSSAVTTAVPLFMTTTPAAQFAILAAV